VALALDVDAEASRDVAQRLDLVLCLERADRALEERLVLAKHDNVINVEPEHGQAVGRVLVVEARIRLALVVAEVVD